MKSVGRVESAATAVGLLLLHLVSLSPSCKCSFCCCGGVNTCIAFKVSHVYVEGCRFPENSSEAI